MRKIFFIVSIVCSTLVFAQEENQVDTHKLEKVQKVISASGFLQDIKNAPSTIDIISNKEILQKNYFDIAGVVDGLPGVDTRTEWGSSGASAIAIRGLPAKYTLILFDGLRNDNSAPTTTEHFGFPQQANLFMPPNVAIDRVEVIRGPMSVLYDSDALGGIVNMILKQPNLQKVDASFNADTTVNFIKKFGNTSNFNGYLSAPLITDKLALSLRGKLIYRTPWNIKARFYEDYNGTPYGDKKLYHPFHGQNPQEAIIGYGGARLLYKINENNIFYIDGAFLNMWLDNHDETIGEHERFIPDQRGKRVNVFGVLESNFDQISNKLTLQRNFSQSTLEWDQTNSARKADCSTRTCDPRINEAVDYILEDKVTIYDFYKNTISIGGRYWNQQFYDKTVSPKYIVSNAISAFLETNYNPIDPLFITIGARYGYHSNANFGHSFIPKGYVNYEAINSDNQSLVIKGGISSGYKLPYITDITANPRIGRATALVVGNPQLRPESSISYELGAIYNYENMQLGITYYHNQFFNKIVRVQRKKTDASPQSCKDGYAKFSDTTTCSVRENIRDDAYIHGVEATFDLMDFYSLSWNLSYSFTTSQTKDKNVVKPLVNTPKHQVYTKLVYDFQKAADLGFIFRYEGQRAIDAAASEYIWIVKPGTGEKASPKEPNNPSQRPDLKYFKSFVTLDLVSNFYVGKTASIHFGVYNLLNHNFADENSFLPISYKRTLKSGAIDPFLWSKDYTTILEGIRLYASVTVNF